MLLKPEYFHSTCTVALVDPHQPQTLRVSQARTVGSEMTVNLIQCHGFATPDLVKHVTVNKLLPLLVAVALINARF